ncbi:MAG: RNA methyltransferase [Treponema sp.]|nr:RNA methyltransferase [Treponema sp.]
MKNKRNNELAVCGFAAVKVLEKIHSEKITRLYFTEERAPLFGGLCKKLAATKRPYNKVKDPSELEKLCGSVHHQGVVAMIEAPQIENLNKEITAEWVRNKESAVLLDRVGNANNLGAIVRSAAFFGIKNIIIPVDEAQSSVTTSSYRVAEGGMEFVNIYAVKSIPYLLEDLKGKLVRIGTALDAAIPVSEIKKLRGDKGVIVVLGNEEHGISSEVKKNCDYNVIIPFAGMNESALLPKVDSLNVAQAASVIMYELRS